MVNSDTNNKEGEKDIVALVELVHAVQEHNEVLKEILHDIEIARKEYDILNT
jgi:hypothetical protein